MMLRRVAAKTTMAAAAPLLSSTRAYNMFVFKDPVRRPQLSPEERAKVKINYAEWPEEFRDYDPEDPYKNSPEIIEGLSSWNLFLWGVECAFIYQFYEVVFPKSI
ncbi:protein of unknown function - conserved [Leishmania donovani]|uniref:Uncharacterized protein n=4 Tax=Leishmania donovani species complex TaxID=38574 RepID=A4IAH2_LEIIN|nr:conserved hypothetical protein [Leishmania infantum JPCM5]XP_003864543.1 hypothetical protein, conserved [Leishmania donovani]CAC9541472.1 hypothetical_protein_-_conserved [Leishmania infantum]AYU82751.1 hypothetical protein LdCL_340047800 [Leishmania donovani]CAJ1992767.1 protein of unknown function - conserved [Leishmania donovani]CAM71829.1 conserved hypothetical protein [Leishmania infantum JPCM5]CBZ37861.1 hypothetical protein, conserved [Leishmania donovani]|eukprot:XP_001468741.1 conserved hypothetical protein [Leishmania infantum JPCM5]